MKVVILAGGYGTRISEETDIKPKPMVEIGEQPIIWHIMKIYSQYGFNEFIICLGYKAYKIKEYFNDYYLHTSDVTFDFKKNIITTHHNYSENWKVTLVDTGLRTLTGGRINRIKEYLSNEPFLLTYGDGVGDIDIPKVIDFHKKTNKIATITSYNFGQRFGILDIDKNGIVNEFREKKYSDGNLINAGYMVLNPEIFNYFPENSDNIMFEEILEKLAKDKQLSAYEHKGFWYGMDTLRDKKILEEMWYSDNAKWKIWED